MVEWTIIFVPFPSLLNSKTFFFLSLNFEAMSLLWIVPTASCMSLFTCFSGCKHKEVSRNINLIKWKATHPYLKVCFVFLLLFISLLVLALFLIFQGSLELAVRHLGFLTIQYCLCHVPTFLKIPIKRAIYITVLSYIVMNGQVTLTSIPLNLLLFPIHLEQRNSQPTSIQMHPQYLDSDVFQHQF